MRRIDEIDRKMEIDRQRENFRYIRQRNKKRDGSESSSNIGGYLTSSL